MEPQRAGSMPMLRRGVPVTSTASLKVSVTCMVSPRPQVSPDAGVEDTETTVTSGYVPAAGVAVALALAPLLTLETARTWKV